VTKKAIPNIAKRKYLLRGSVTHGSAKHVRVGWVVTYQWWSESWDFH